MRKKTRPTRRGRSRGPAVDGGEARRAFPIVGIGASAGGLDALERLLKNVPADTGMAFLIVQHLDPKHESRLSAILSRTTSMPVAEAKDRMKIVRDHVYIIPPNTSMFVRDTALSLEPRQQALSKHLPVDSLLRSLAAAQKNMAIGVILSGTASDGAAGMRAIKNGGGITFAQDAHSAKYYGMPHASIASGAVDFVMPPEEIATSLARIGLHPYVALPDAPAARQTPTTPEIGRADPLGHLFHLLKKRFRVDFSAYKPSTIGRRIRRRMALHGIHDLADYVRHVAQNSDELRTLYQDMFIGVTGFFREPEAFDALKTRVFPLLFKDRPPAVPIRLWVPGCSTGEEVYSLAISLLEFRRNRADRPSIQVFGTDVNEQAIKQARSGRYAEDIVSDVGEKRLQRFFVKTDQGYQVNQMVRDVCVFAKHDILRDPPFSKLDLLSCRNVLIYLDTAAQRKLLPLFHYTLKPSGFLMLGSSETVGNFGELFKVAERRNKIYSKRITVERPRFDWLAEPEPRSELADPRAESVMRRSEFDLQKDAADLIILNEYAPPAVLVNEDMEILHFRGHTGAYLEPSPGVASLNLMKMAREGLVGGLRTAFQNARKKDAPAMVGGLHVAINGAEKTIDLSVVPVKSPDSQHRSYLVLFRDAGDRAVPQPAPGSRKASVERAHEQRLGQLKQELTTTKAYLQSVIESQDAANEELRSLNEEHLSTNEELQSTTEELETSNEELQSANEELITLNEELEHRNAELGQAHNDILNLLNSLSLSLIIVDRNLRIRRLTATALKEMRLLPSDEGRSLTDIPLVVEIPELEAIAQGVMEKVGVVSLELLGRDKRWRHVQFSSYVTADGEIQGAILSIADIHVAKLAEDKFRALVESAPDAMVITDAAGQIRLVNGQAVRLFGYGREELIGQPVETLVPQQLREIHRGHRQVYGQELVARPMGSGLQLAALHKDGRTIPVEVSLSPIPTVEGVLVSATIRDITDRKRSELEARRFAVLAERGLARDVHDNLAQGLSGIVMHLEGAADVLEEKPEEALRQVVQARDLARSSLKQARRSLLALRSEILEETDLAGGLQRIADEMCEGTSIQARVKVRGSARSLAVEVEENLLRIGQEAIANAVKHGTPTCITVELTYEVNRVRLTIVDDGRGFSAQARGRASGLGISIMKGRARSIGGLLDIRSEPDRGTTMEAVVPVGADDSSGGDS